CAAVEAWKGARPETPRHGSLRQTANVRSRSGSRSPLNPPYRGWERYKQQCSACYTCTGAPDPRHRGVPFRGTEWSLTGRLSAVGDALRAFEVRRSPDRVIDAVPQLVTTMTQDRPLAAALEPPRRVKASSPQRGRLGKTNRPDDREHRDEDPEGAQLRLPLQETDESEYNVDADDASEDPVRYVLARVAPERDGREQAQGAEGEAHQRRLDRTAALPAPVHILEVKGERELVESERGADSEQSRQQKHGVIARAKGDDRGCRAETGHDPRDEMMQVQTLHRPAPPHVQTPEARVGTH